MKYSDKVIERFGGTIFEHIQESVWSRIVTYIINSKYRKSVKLKEWIRSQVDFFSHEVVELAMGIPDSVDADTQMQYILQFVRKKFTYIPDHDTWMMSEYWQTAEESSNTMTGDCEDGAVLMYVLARFKGIPANRLMLFTGDVDWNNNVAGHCWLGFKPYNYPHNFGFMDWCYDVDINSVRCRNKFSIIKRNITEYKSDGKKVNSVYKRIWFGVNECVSTTKL